MEIKDVNDVPDLAAAVVDRRAGKPPDPRRFLRKERRSAVFFRAAVPKLLNFVKDHGFKSNLRQRGFPPAQQQIMNDIDLRFRQLIGF